MNTLDMIGLVDAMQKRLLARVNLADADYADVIEDRLELAALASLNAALKGAPETAAFSVLVQRMARLEARVEALSLAFFSGPAVESAQSPAPLAALESAVVPLDESAAQSGFYTCERPEPGVFFRWLGPKPRARVHLPKVALPAQVTLVLYTVYKGIDIGAIRVALNDGPWSAVEGIDLSANALRYRPQAGSGGEGLAHYLDIDCGATFRPADEGSPDDRSLGIALSRIELVSV